MIKCIACKFWDKQNEAAEFDVGLCRILPPTHDKALAIAIWPVSLETDSCGAGKPK